MSSGIKINDNGLWVDFDYLMESMSSEDQKMFIKKFAIESNVIDHVVNYICGEDPDGWWSGCADDRRMKILTKVENAQLNKWSGYNWKFIDEATNRLKEIKEKQHIYWALYHSGVDYDSDFSMKVRKFLESNGIESDYTTKQADEEIEKVYSIIKEAMEKLSSKTKEDQ